MESQNIWSVIGGLLAQMASGIGNYIPNFLGGLFVFIIGIILSSWLRRLLISGLQALHFETLIKDTKIRDYLTKAEIPTKAEEILGSLVKWLVLITFFIAATNIWGLHTVAELLSRVLGYLPNVISALIVLALGVLLAGIAESAIKAALTGFDLHAARLLGKIGSYAVMVIAGLAAISELEIAQNFINILFIGFVATLSLGFGLAIGLGAKDTVNKILSRWYKNL